MKYPKSLNPVRVVFPDLKKQIVTAKYLPWISIVYFMGTKGSVLEDNSMGHKNLHLINSARAFSMNSGRDRGMGSGSPGFECATKTVCSDED